MFVGIVSWSTLLSADRGVKAFGNVSLGCLSTIFLVWTQPCTPRPGNFITLNGRDPAGQSSHGYTFTTTEYHDSGMGSQPSGQSSQTSPTTGLRQCRRPPAKIWLTQAFGRAGLCGTSRGLLCRRMGVSGNAGLRPKLAFGEWGSVFYLVLAVGRSPIGSLTACKCLYPLSSVDMCL